MESYDTECCICFEVIGEKNNCVTPCGHKFCFQCMSRALAKNNTCPCCRTVLMEVEEDEEYDEAYESSNDESDSDSDDESEDEELRYPYCQPTAPQAEEMVDKIHAHLLEKGHSQKDILAYFMNIRALWDAGGFISRIRKIGDDYWDFMFKLEHEQNEREREEEERQLFAMEDESIRNVNRNLKPEFDEEAVSEENDDEENIENVFWEIVRTPNVDIIRDHIHNFYTMNDVITGNQSVITVNDSVNRYFTDL